MEVLRFSAGAVAPLIFIVGLGWFMRFRGIVGESFIAPLNKSVFNVFFPIMLFDNIYRSNFQEEFDLLLVGMVLVFVLIIAAIAFFVFPLVTKDKGHAIINLTAAFRSNFIIFAFAILPIMYGPGGARLAAIIMPFTTVTFNIVGIALMRHFSPNKQQNSTSSTAREIATNPLIISCIIAAILAIFEIGVRFPEVLSTAIGSVGGMAAPLGLILMGTQLKSNGFRDNLGDVLQGCFVRLVVVPVMGVIIAVNLGFMGIELATLLLLFGGPPPTVLVIKARNYNIAPEYTAQFVAAATVMSIGTLFVGISILRWMELI